MMIYHVLNYVQLGIWCSRAIRFRAKRSRAMGHLIHDLECYRVSLKTLPGYTGSLDTVSWYTVSCYTVYCNAVSCYIIWSHAITLALVIASTARVSWAVRNSCSLEPPVGRAARSTLRAVRAALWNILKQFYFHMTWYMTYITYIEI